MPYADSYHHPTSTVKAARRRLRRLRIRMDRVVKGYHVTYGAYRA